MVIVPLVTGCPPHKGGGGGFRSSSAKGGSRSYGYSSSALSTRYPSGYTRTSYGYRGRTAVIAGA